MMFNCPYCRSRNYSNYYSGIGNYSEYTCTDCGKHWWQDVKDVSGKPILSPPKKPIEARERKLLYSGNTEDTDAELRKILATDGLSEVREEEKPIIIYNADYPAKGYSRKIAEEIKAHFSSRLRLLDRIYFEVFDSLDRPFSRKEVPNGLVVLEIRMPPQEGISTSSVFGKDRLLSESVGRYIDENFPLHLVASVSFGNTHILRYVYDESKTKIGKIPWKGDLSSPTEVGEVPESPKTHLIEYEAEAYARKLLNEKRDRGYVYTALLSKYRNKLLPAEIDRVFKAALLQIGEQNQPISWATRYRICPKSGSPPHKSRGWRFWEKRFLKGDLSMIPIGIDDETGKQIFRCTICGYEELESEKQKGKERKITLPRRLPNLLILLIGMTLFGIEITTFGSGDYAMGSAGFIFGGGVIGFASWILDYRGKKKKQEEDEEKNTGLAEVGAAVEPKKETTAAIPSYASMAGVLNKEEEE